MGAHETHQLRNDRIRIEVGRTPDGGFALTSLMATLCNKESPTWRPDLVCSPSHERRKIDGSQVGDVSASTRSKEWLVGAAPLYEIEIAVPGESRPRIASSLDPHRDIHVENEEISGGRQLAIHASHSLLPLDVSVFINTYTDHGVIRSWAEFRPQGQALFRVLRSQLLTLSLNRSGDTLTAYCGLERYNGGPDWYTWREVPLTHLTVDTVESGWMKEATWLGIVDSKQGPGIWCAWEANVSCVARYGDLFAGGGLNIHLSTEPDFLIAADRSYQTPKAVVGLAAGSLDDLCYENHRFINDVLALPIHDERFPWVMYNSWGYTADIDEAKMEQCIDLCSELGIEGFVVDFGWEDADWNVRSDKFPNGLAPLARKVHDRGMLFGLHLSFGNISNLSQVIKNHPNWGIEVGKWAYRDKGQVYRLILGNPDARKWIVDQAVKIIHENDVDYILTDHFLWGWSLPGKQPMHSNREYNSIVEGYDRALEEIRERCPGLVIEHCDNGGSLITHRMPQLHHTSIGADAPGPLPERFAKYRLSHVLPPRYLDSYARDLSTDDVELDKYALRSYFLGGPLILMNRIQELCERSEDWATLKEGLALYKRIRRQVLEGQVLHLISPRSPLSLGVDWDGWDAIGTYHKASDSAIVFVFRLGSEVGEKRIPIHGLKTSTQYRVRFHDAKTEWVATGESLMRQGILVSVDESAVHRIAKGPARFSELIFITPAET